MSNATETAPELTRLGVPAVFYVVTSFLSNGDPLWFDRYGALRRARFSRAEQLVLGMFDGQKHRGEVQRSVPSSLRNMDHKQAVILPKRAA